MTVQRTDPGMVTSIVTDLPARQPRIRSVTGYGTKLPTAYRIRYGNRWHRLYVVNYGNAGSLYIEKSGNRLFLDIATEYALSDGLANASLGI